MLYFDHNATHPLSSAARAAWLAAVDRFPANPSSPHRLGQRADTALESARAELGSHLGVSPDRIIFTSGATEANNTVLARFERVWISAIEHPCVVAPAQRKECAILPVTRSGIVDLDFLRDQLARTKPDLVAVMAANNETGVLQPWQAVSALCRDAGIPFLCDAAQWIGKLPSMGMDTPMFVSGCAHKFGGPTGVGFLVAPRDFPGLLRGGPQEDGRRAGTENVAGILSMVAALSDRLVNDQGALTKRMAWRTAFEKAVSAIPGVEILGREEERLWNTVSVLMPDAPDCRRRWVVVLDKLGAAVSTGSACASGKEKPSHVLTAMGVEPSDAGRAIRFSAGWETTEADWERLLGIVQQAVAEVMAGR